jgi:2,3-dihydroxybiphenyl 1,2-dioxygenase
MSDSDMSSSAVPLAGLAYLGVAADDLDAWRRFAATILGVQPDEPDDRSLVLRIDAKQTRLLIEQGPVGVNNGCRYIGWLLAPGVEIDAAAARLEQLGVAYRTGTPAECARRAVDRMIWFTDPLGNRVECCSGHRDAVDAPVFTRPLAGFKTGDLGLGHVVLLAQQPDVVISFYQRVLGFRLSDTAERPFEAAFMHVNPRHHSLAIIRGERDALHHLMVEMLSFDDVGQAYDLVHHRKVQIGASLGRHSNDYMTSFYVMTPSRFMLEIGWGGRLVDMDNWTPEVLTCGPSLWGHERTWLPERTRRDAEQMRLQAATDGLKAPLQVRDGFFTEIP